MKFDLSFRKAARRPPPLIAVASGKGGVGKTWLAITLAHALSRAGHRTLLFDGDLGLANVDIQLGLLPQYDLGTVLAGRATLGQAVLRPEGTALDVLAGRSGSGSLAGLEPRRLDELVDALRTLSDGYDAILLDVGAGVDRAQRRIAARSDMLLVLTTEEPSSLTDAYAVIKLHLADHPEGDARVVVNQAGSAKTGWETYESLRRACDRFLRKTPPLAGVIRHDDHVREAIRRQALLLVRSPTCVAAEDIEALARRVLTS